MHLHTMDSLRVEADHRREQLTKVWQRPSWGTVLRRWRDTPARRVTAGRNGGEDATLPPMRERRHL